MKIADAEREIMAEMRRRLPTIPYAGTDGGLLQYLEIYRERPDLFTFAGGASDPWQTVQAWLSKWGLVKR
jgi:hypothetical protein